MTQNVRSPRPRKIHLLKAVDTSQSSILTVSLEDGGGCRGGCFQMDWCSSPSFTSTWMSGSPGSHPLHPQLRQVQQPNRGDPGYRTVSQVPGSQNLGGDESWESGSGDHSFLLVPLTSNSPTAQQHWGSSTTNYYHQDHDLDVAMFC